MTSGQPPKAPRRLTAPWFLTSGQPVGRRRRRPPSAGDPQRRHPSGFKLVVGAGRGARSGALGLGSGALGAALGRRGGSCRRKAVAGGEGPAEGGRAGESRHAGRGAAGVAGPAPRPGSHRPGRGRRGGPCARDHRLTAGQTVWPLRLVGRMVDRHSRRCGRRRRFSASP